MSIIANDNKRGIHLIEEKGAVPNAADRKRKTASIGRVRKLMGEEYAWRPCADAVMEAYIGADGYAEDSCGNIRLDRIGDLMNAAALVAEQATRHLGASSREDDVPFSNASDIRRRQFSDVLGDPEPEVKGERSLQHLMQAHHNLCQAQHVSGTAAQIAQQKLAMPEMLAKGAALQTTLSEAFAAMQQDATEGLKALDRRYPGVSPDARELLQTRIDLLACAAEYMAKTDLKLGSGKGMGY